MGGFVHTMLTLLLIDETLSKRFRALCIPGFCVSYFYKMVHHNQDIPVFILREGQRTHDIYAHSFSWKPRGEDAVVQLP